MGSDSAVIAVLATMGVHAVFFGAGRYSLVVFPLLSAVAPLALGVAALTGSRSRAYSTRREFPEVEEGPRCP